MEELRARPKGADEGEGTASEKFGFKISKVERSYEKKAGGAQQNGDIKNV